MEQFKVLDTKILLKRLQNIDGINKQEVIATRAYTYYKFIKNAVEDIFGKIPEGKEYVPTAIYCDKLTYDLLLELFPDIRQIELPEIDSTVHNYTIKIDKTKGIREK